VAPAYDLFLLLSFAFSPFRSIFLILLLLFLGRRAQGRTRVMGILNITPDSFSDGGDLLNVATALARAKDMVAAGADMLDVGGQSTRPGSARLPAAEEAARVVPVIRRVAIYCFACLFSVLFFSFIFCPLNPSHRAACRPGMLGWNLELARCDCAAVLCSGMDGQPHEGRKVLDCPAEQAKSIWQSSQGCRCGTHSKT
jgi:hypothetical protein